MSMYVFEPVSLPGGIIKMSVINDDSNSHIINVSGNYLITLAELDESVEENGFGGIPLISQLDIEVYDRERIFHDRIFNISPLSVRARITITIGGTEYPVIYGKIFSQTINYNEIFDNEYTCKFTILSMASNLSEVPVATLRTNLIANASVTKTLSSSISGVPYMRCFSLQSIIAEIQKLLFTGVNVTAPVITIAHSFISVEDPATEYSIDDIFIRYLSGSAQGGNRDADIWATDNNPRSLLNLGDCLTLLQRLCSMLMAYPLVKYDLPTDSFHIEIKQRFAGNQIANPGELLSIINGSEQYPLETRFAGYDAIRVTNTNDNETHYFYPHTLNDDAFTIVKQKFDFQSLFSMRHDHPVQFEKDIYVTLNGNVVSPLEIIVTQNAYQYDEWNEFLGAQFSSLWVNPVMYERVYSGVGIAGDDAMELLDQLTIALFPRTIIEIKRDFVNNTKLIKSIMFGYL